LFGIDEVCDALTSSKLALIALFLKFCGTSAQFYLGLTLPQFAEQEPQLVVIFVEG
jgi:hypothetical protein